MDYHEDSKRTQWQSHIEEATLVIHHVTLEISAAVKHRRREVYIPRRNNKWCIINNREYRSWWPDSNKTLSGIPGVIENMLEFPELLEMWIEEK